MEFAERQYLASADMHVKGEDFAFEYLKGEEVDLNRDADGNVFIRHFGENGVYEMTINRRQDLNHLFEWIVSVEDELDETVSFKDLEIREFVDNGVTSDMGVNHMLKSSNWEYNVDRDIVVIRSVPIRKRHKRQSLTAKHEAFTRTSPTDRRPHARVSALASIGVREANSLNSTGYMIDKTSMLASANHDEFRQLRQQVTRLDDVESVRQLNTGRLHVELFEGSSDKDFLRAMGKIEMPFNLIRRTDGTYYLESLLHDVVEYEIIDGDDYLADNMAVMGMGDLSPRPPDGPVGRRTDLDDDDDMDMDEYDDMDMDEDDDDMDMVGDVDEDDDDMDMEPMMAGSMRDRSMRRRSVRSAAMRRPMRASHHMMDDDDEDDEMGLIGMDMDEDDMDDEDEERSDAEDDGDA